MKNTVKITARTAMLAAVIFCLTYFVKIPFPGGYVHLGDAAISLAALWLPAPWAMAAAAVGAGLADIAGGYATYAPITLVTKAVMALVAAPILRKRFCHESMIVSINKPCIYPFSLSRNASNSGMVMRTCLARVLLSSLTTPASAS